jgi:hypothetical protein
MFYDMVEFCNVTDAQLMTHHIQAQPLGHPRAEALPEATFDLRSGCALRV